MLPGSRTGGHRATRGCSKLTSSIPASLRRICHGDSNHFSGSACIEVRGDISAVNGPTLIDEVGTAIEPVTFAFVRRRDGVGRSNETTGTIPLLWRHLVP